MSIRVVIVGAGISGCAAALAAKQAGADVTLIERTDTLVNAARRAGRIFNGSLAAWEEAKALGGGAILDLLDSIILHRTGIAGESRCVVYDCGLIEPMICRLLRNTGIELLTETRAIDASSIGPRVVGVILENGKELQADAIVDASGTAGGFEHCTRYGGGCVMCLYKCPAFGDRVSISTRLGGVELVRRRANGKPGRVGAAVSVHKRSLSSELRNRVETEGTVLIPIPDDMIQSNLLKLRDQNSGRTEEQMKTLNLVDIGIVAKLVGASYLPLSVLKCVPGFENAAIEEPQGASKYNRITGLSIMLHDHALRVEGFNNLFCVGEHSGSHGVMDCLTSGLLGGHNAVKAALGREPLVLTRQLVIGEAIAFFADSIRNEETLQARLGNTGQGVFYEHLVKLGLYTEDTEIIRRRVDENRLTGIFAQNLVT